MGLLICAHDIIEMDNNLKPNPPFSQKKTIFFLILKKIRISKALMQAGTTPIGANA